MNDEIKVEFLELIKDCLNNNCEHDIIISDYLIPEFQKSIESDSCSFADYFADDISQESYDFLKFFQINKNYGVAWDKAFQLCQDLIEDLMSIAGNLINEYCREFNLG